MDIIEKLGNMVMAECEFEYFSVSDIKQAVQNYKGQKHE